MKTAITVVVAIAILIGGYIFIKDRQIKDELSKVEESKQVDSSGSNTANVDSKISLTRTDGNWTVNSDGDYTIDPASLKFEFTGYKPGGQHVGTFQNMTASISLDDNGNPVLSTLTFDPKSVKTDTEQVDKHLQAPEFFETAVHPEVMVEIKEIQKDGNGAKAITDITIKGNTKTYAVPVTMSEVEGGMKFDVDTRITISDFKIAYGPVQDEVRVTLSGVIKKK